VAAEAYGDLDTASGEAEEAVGRLSGVEAKGYLAAALEVLGRSCVTQDRARSVEALDRAAATFDACAAAARRERVVQLLQSLGASGQRAAAAFGPGSLTARERDVARLAAQGYPARQIADELFIGVRTVEGHLARSYAKLGVTSKIELVRRAVEFGLD
jgi:DNA-binding CsgD family transcriptional regulator